MIRRALTLSLSVATLSAFAAALPAGSADAASRLQITTAYVNSPGADRGGNSSLNAEYIKIKNTSGSTVTMTGYTLSDRSHHFYHFGTFTLKAGTSVTVRTGHGRDTTATRYWDQNWYIWNNDGDTATLRTNHGTTIDSCSWKTVSSSKAC